MVITSPVLNIELRNSDIFHDVQYTAIDQQWQKDILQFSKNFVIGQYALRFLARNCGDMS